LLATELIDLDQGKMNVNAGGKVIAGLGMEAN